jgi:flagellin-like hook-associated protein FlgL
MCAISSIPTTRLSNQFMTLRVLTQIHADQNDLFEIQNQLSTGLRIARPSDDAPTAARAMTLQSLLERKTAVKASLGGIQNRLAATETAVGNVGATLVDLRATALSVVGTAISQHERDAAVAQFDQAIEQLLAVGNQTFQGSYLFSGSRTQTAPLAKLEAGIAYRGNENSLPAYSDVDQLFSAGVTGDRVFGLLSQTVRGSADLNPVVTWNTRLAELNGGQGVRIGSVSLTDGTSTSVVNIAGAATIGDVARLLEANPPLGRVVTARVTSRGLEVSLDAGNLSIGEVGNGSTAAELGIKRINGSDPGPIVGSDLNPQVTLLTRLDDVLGSRARAYLSNIGAANDLIVEAAQSGVAANNVTIKYVDDDWFQATAGITAGNEFANYYASATAATAVLKFPGHPGLDNGLQLTAATSGSAMNGVAIGVTVRTVDGLGPQFNYNPTAKAYSVSVEAGTTVAQLATAISTSGGPFTAAVTSLGDG